MKKIFIPVIVGPTASGKTALSIELAKKYNAEIVSADSMQIYTSMDIATAKPTKDEMQGIPHHLIDFVSPDTIFSLADYVKCANRVIRDIDLRGKMPLMVGGTGLYIDTVIDNITLTETKTDYELRKKLQSQAEKLGNEAMWKRLYEVDEKTAGLLHPNNIGRIIRALEVYEQTGVPISKHNEESRMEKSPYFPVFIGLDYKDREILYDRINRRVDLMLENGLLEEAQEIYNKKDRKDTSFQAIGYKELVPYFEGIKTLEECVEILKQKTRNYAKRQLTWFRKNERINWIYSDECGNFENVLEKAQNFVEIFMEKCK